MSYILNALKKAEQERLRDDPKDLEDFASARWDPYEQKASSNKVVMVLAFVLLLAIIFAPAIYWLEFKPLPQKNEILPVKLPVPEVVKQPAIVLDRKVETDPFALPALEISGHIYFAQGSKSNRLFANDQSYKEGDLIANGWRLTAIRIDGIEMAKQKRSVFVAYP
jgi:hypothetical protein